MAAKKTAAPKTKTKKAIRSNGNRMLLELNESDYDLLEGIVARYYDKVRSPNKAFVVRQLIRNAAESKDLPPLKLP